MVSKICPDYNMEISNEKYETMAFGGNEYVRKGDQVTGEVKNLKWEISYEHDCAKI